MMTTNLFVITNVKQLRTDGSFRILLPFFRTSWGVDVLDSANFNSFHNRVDFGTILEGLRNLGEGVWKLPTPTSVCHHLTGVNDAMLKSAPVLQKDLDVLLRQQADECSAPHKMAAVRPYGKYWPCFVVLTPCGSGLCCRTCEEFLLNH